MKEFLYLDPLSPSDSKLEDSPPRYLARAFLEKRAKFGERKPLGFVEKVEEGGGVGFLQDTTGSRKHEAYAAFLP